MNLMAKCSTLITAELSDATSMPVLGTGLNPLETSAVGVIISNLRCQMVLLN